MLYYNSSFNNGVWRSLVARSAGGREVAGSNPVTPIFIKSRVSGVSFHQKLFCLLTVTFFFLITIPPRFLTCMLPRYFFSYHIFIRFL